MTTPEDTSPTAEPGSAPETAPEPAPETDQLAAAQRPKLANRLRLLPLAALCLCVVATAVVGAVHGGTLVGGAGPAAAEAAAAAQTRRAEREERQAERAVDRAKNACTPKFNPGHKTEPWRGKAKKVSERAFQKAIKKENPGYVRGKDGWLFFTDYQVENFSQALGRVTQTYQEEKAWAKLFRKQAKAVEQAGGKYYVVVAPANWDVYPQKLPAWAQKLRGTTSLEKLMADHPELPWLDLRAPLQKAAKKHDTYEPLNSHWSPYGGYVAWQAISKCLRASDPSLSSVAAPPINGVGIEANSNEFAMNGVPDGKPRRTYPIYLSPHPATTLTHLPDNGPVANVADDSVDMTLLPIRATTPGAQSPLKLLALRDSTGSALSPLWSWSFGNTVQYGHEIGSNNQPTPLAQILAAEHPDVVLFVMTERYLSLPPKS
jgi:acetyltransferase AlgX (SGNH hydrolase-like protein)